MLVANAGVCRAMFSGPFASLADMEMVVSQRDKVTGILFFDCSSQRHQVSRAYSIACCGDLREREYQHSVRSARRTGDAASVERRRREPAKALLP